MIRRTAMASPTNISSIMVRMSSRASTPRSSMRAQQRKNSCSSSVPVKRVWHRMLSRAGTTSDEGVLSSQLYRTLSEYERTGGTCSCVHTCRRGMVIGTGIRTSASGGRVWT